MGIFDDVLNSAKTGNFEEVLTKTKTYAEDAAKKSAERLEISKKKIELLDSKTKLVKAYENYGRLQYALVEGDEVSPEELKTVEEEIQLQKNRTEYLDAEVEELRQKFLDSLSRKTKKYTSVKLAAVKKRLFVKLAATQGIRHPTSALMPRRMTNNLPV